MKPAAAACSHSISFESLEEALKMRRHWILSGWIFVAHCCKILIADHWLLLPRQSLVWNCSQGPQLRFHHFRCPQESVNSNPHWFSLSFQSNSLVFLVSEIDDFLDSTIDHDFFPRPNSLLDYFGFELHRMVPRGQLGYRCRHKRCLQAMREKVWKKRSSLKREC
jgi:hypothetical protein